LSLAFYRKIFGADYSKVPPLPLPQRETILNKRLLLPLVFSESTVGKRLQELLDR
jgi:hypothetical protein